MRVAFYPEKKLKKEILEIIGKHLDLSRYKVFFFGSRVAGKGNERSDIDIGIKGPEPATFRVMADIEEEIDNLPLLYKIDVVDFASVSPEFSEVSLEQTEFLN